MKNQGNLIHSCPEINQEVVLMILNLRQQNANHFPLAYESQLIDSYIIVSQLRLIKEGIEIC